MEIAILVLSIISVFLLGTLVFLNLRKKPSLETNNDEEIIRKSITASFTESTPIMLNAIKENNSAFIEKIEGEIKHLKESLDSFSKALSEKLKDMNETVDKNLSELRRQNNEKLENIQKTVDEKLDKTLSDKLSSSFESVIKQIGEVTKTIGEIKGLATDVSQLNRVLTNVKTKGIVGEVILGNIISEILAKNQYEENFVTKENSTLPVEYAVKMPGHDDGYVYMPIDSKFPLENYHKLRDAIDNCDKDALAQARKDLRSQLKKYAKDISEKYVEPPRTTDFAIMFLPIEGLYVEAIDMGLFEEIQREYKISIAGPSTLTALLNSLQMGFKSLEIQKHSSDVFNLLSAVKAEFGNFAKVLDNVQKKYDQASKEMNTLVTTRTNAINRKLRTITAMDEDEAHELLGIENEPLIEE